MPTYLVLIPVGPGQSLGFTLDGKYQIYEMGSDLVTPVQPRPVMPGMHTWQNCKNKEEAIAVAKNEAPLPTYLSRYQDELENPDDIDDDEDLEDFEEKHLGHPGNPSDYGDS